MQRPNNVQSVADVKDPWQVTVKVDWKTLAMPDAQAAYAKLKTEFEKAGAILNERSTPRTDSFHCFMGGKPGGCELGKIYTGNAAGQDLSYKAPKGGYVDKATGARTPEGIVVPVKVCSERCWLLYQQIQIKERRDRMNPGLNG